MLDTSFYIVTAEVAIRSGVIAQRYRTSDGRYILDNKDLGRVRLNSDEFVSGLAGVEKVSGEKAKSLIASNGYRKGYEGLQHANTDEPTTDTDNAKNLNSQEQKIQTLPNTSLSDGVAITNVDTVDEFENNPISTTITRVRRRIK